MTLVARSASMIRRSRVSARRPINLLRDAELVDKARAYGVNVSAVGKDALRARIVKEEAQAWLDES